MEPEVERVRQRARQPEHQAVHDERKNAERQDDDRERENFCARTGANTVPTTPTVSGNSATVRPSCLMITRRTLPSWTIFFTQSTSWSAVTLIVSLKVFSLMLPRKTVRSSLYTNSDTDPFGEY